MMRCSTLFAVCLLLAQPAWSWAESDANENSNDNTAVISQQNIKPSDIKQATANKAVETSNQVDINILKKRLRKTSAIGFFTKLAIRNDLIDLMDEIKKYRKKSVPGDKLDEIRASFDGLLLKLIALLDEDPDLSRDLYVGRELIWKSLFEEKA
ncbi:MAG: hypothetical protein Q9M16_05165 [Mariprofundus sp.]|nr:hypothetical protein [Mariprofundus sp.]